MPAHALTLMEIPGLHAICRLDRAAPVPAWASHGAFVSITRTAEELSIVCDAAAVPDGVQCERGWRCLKVLGPLAFSLVGIVAALVTPLADAGVSVFVVSTFDTDYLLVTQGRFDDAVGVLRQSGHQVTRCTSSA